MTRFVLPGDAISLDPIQAASNQPLYIGSGLVHDEKDNLCLVTQMGVLIVDGPKNRMFVETCGGIYEPLAEDYVIGVVRGLKAGEFYRIDIGSDQEALLPVLAFDGATKRNRPMLENGSFIYAKVAQTREDMSPVLSCHMTFQSYAKDWVTNECVFGPLKGGFVTQVSAALCRMLMDLKQEQILSLIGKKIAYEVAIGMNGKIWINSESSENTIRLHLLFQRMKNKSPVECLDLVKNTI
jgi:exosome complex component RRP40